jgi:acetyl esterase/lipase
VSYVAGEPYAQDKDKLDLYLPEGPSDVPVMVWIHGGGLQDGDKRRQGPLARRFAAAGIATAAVNYRLSPGVAHPAHVQDVAAAFAWVKRHIARFGGNPERIFVVGHSAGAYLTALLATDERYLGVHGLSLRDVQGAAPVSGFFWVEREGVAPDRPKTLWGADPKAWPDASPAHHLHPGVPRMLILYADGDDPWRRQQNVEMGERLRRAAGAPVDVVEVPDRSHVSIWERLSQPGDPVSERIIAFVKGSR